MIRIYPFQTQEVRDLAWACFSPPLLHMDQVTSDTSTISACALQLTPARQLWLERLDRDASALLEHLQRRPTHRLGVYFEQLWQFFLQQDPDVELIAHNLPIHDNGRTLGEFDCIYRCHQRERDVHLELAVKFFLGLPYNSAETNNGTGQLQEWLGPDARDRLDLKLNHLLERQILLGERPQARKRLRAMGVENLSTEIAFKGYLFQHEHNAPPLPAGYNTDRKMERWVAFTQMRPYLSTLDAEVFLVVPKMMWLGAVHCNNPDRTLTAEELSSQMALHFEADHYPLLVAALDSSGVESARFFVTLPDWPNQPNESPQSFLPPDK